MSSGDVPSLPVAWDAGVVAARPDLYPELHALPVAVIVQGPDTGLRYANPAALDLLGVSADECLGRGAGDAGPHVLRADGSPLPASEHPAALCLAGGRAVRQVLVGYVQPRSGQRRWLSVNAEPRPGPDGRTAEVWVTLVDVTAHREAEERLRESEERYRLLVERAADLIYRTDVGGRFVYVNPAACRVMGLNPEGLLGRHFLELVRADHRARVESLLVRQFRERLPSTYDEFVALAADGREVRLGQHVQLLTQGRRVLGFQAIARQLAQGETHLGSDPAPATDASPRAACVLVVDDNDVNLRVIAAMLENLGYDVETAVNGVEAVDACARSHYDAVLMDCQMPEMDGLRATAFIRERERGQRHTPILALTASVAVGEREKCLAAGMDDFLVKPVGLRQLDEALRRWTGAPAASPATGLTLPEEHPLRPLEAQGQGDVVAEIFSAFIDTTPAYLEQMRVAFASADTRRAQGLAHSLKGAAVQVGADELAELCTRIHSAARAGDENAVWVCLAALEAGFAGLRENLDAQRRQLLAARRP